MEAVEPQQVIEGDRLGDDGDVLAREDGHRDLLNLDAEDRSYVVLETDALIGEVLVPVHEGDHHLDTFLLAGATDAVDSLYVNDADAANLDMVLQ